MPIYFSFFPTGPFIIVLLGGSIMNCMEFVTIAIGAHVYSIRQAVIYFLFSFTRREGNTMAWFLFYYYFSFYFVRTVQAIIYIFIQRELYHNVQALKTDYSSCTGSSSYTAQRSWMNYTYTLCTRQDFVSRVYRMSECSILSCYITAYIKCIHAYYNNI